MYKIYIGVIRMNVFVIIVITLAVHAVLLALASLITPIYVRLVVCAVRYFVR